jgi:lipopolysaccharide biosynthesis regulator YciM
MVTGDEPYTAKATYLRNIVPEDVISANCYVCGKDFFAESEGVWNCPHCKKGHRGPR